MTKWVEETLSGLTLDEKIVLLAGKDVWSTHRIERLDVPDIIVTDGPNGVRGHDDNHGPTATSFPIGIAMGATFDPELISEVGRALAYETKTKGADVLLGPTVNIHRVPNAGRNFECFSEDPLLSGLTAGAYIVGLQSEGVSCCLKHFVANDQEHERNTIDARVGERAMREIYLEPFRIAVEMSNPWSVMSAYNTVNGVTASEQPMLNDVLRAELGFDGVVISDWYGTYSSAASVGGLDLEMPGPARWMAHDHVRAALDAGQITMEDIDAKVVNLLTLIERTGARDKDRTAAPYAAQRDEDRSLAKTVAVESMVLLKNAGALPFAPDTKIALIGDLARHTPHQGGGSSAVNAHQVISVEQGLADMTENLAWSYGCRVHKNAAPLDPTSLAHDNGEGLLVEYFTGRELAGEPVRTEITSKSFLSFFGVGNEYFQYEDFSLRVSGRFVAKEAGQHEFSALGFGQVRVSANGELVVDAWDTPKHEPTTWTQDLQPSESVDLVVEFASVPGEVWRGVGFGCEIPRSEDPIADAAAAATDADVAVIVAGLGADWESEGFDRPDLMLPQDQNALIAAVAAAQPNTVVVLTAGSAVEMPWINDVSAVVQAWYGGQEIGAAVADVLLGVADPGGRLPVTFPATSRQHPGLLNYPGEAGQVHYGEGVYVGYRGYDQLGLEPLFGFGHGLSYTSFDYTHVVAAAENGQIVVQGDLTNSGSRRGVEVVRVFARNVGAIPRQLIGFVKVRLEAGETVPTAVSIPAERLRWWDTEAHAWAFASGTVELVVSGTFGDVELRVELGE